MDPNDVKTLVMAEAWTERSKFRKVFIGNADTWPGDVRLELMSDGSCILAQIDAGAVDHIRLDKPILSEVCLEGLHWLARLRNAETPEYPGSNHISAYLQGLITLNELIDLLTETQLMQERASEVQA